jgi:alpha-glucoside transport system permease protein
MALLEARSDDVGAVPPPSAGARRAPWRDHAWSLMFLVPAAIWLLVVVVYPVFATIRYSFFDESGTSFVGLSNYKSLFTTDTLLTAFRNNVIWVLIFPFFVTFFGLVFAVLTERIRWSTAFKTIIVMPVVFSTTASALVWTSIFDIDPHTGVVNAAVEAISDWFNPPGVYPVNTSAGQTVSALASYGLRPGPSNSLESTGVVHPGEVARLGMIGILPATLQALGARPAATPGATSGAVSGVVWRDFSPSNPGVTNKIFPDEDGLPQLRLALVSMGGKQVATTTTDASGGFRFSSVPAGSYRVEVQPSNFNSGYTGTFWLGAQSLTPTSSLSQTAQALLSVPLVDIAMIIAYLWIWSGFAMVVLGAGLAALDRAVLEAAKVDGATELQIFRRVTMPLLAPVLTVIFVTMVINVLKIFDIIINMAPGSSQQAANTLALAIYNDGFTGGIHTGLASAIAVILFILVIPAMLWNLRKLKSSDASAPPSRRRIRTLFSLRHLKSWGSPQ